MKVIIIGPAHPLRGGLAAFDERLAQAFTDDGNEVEIYSFSLQYPKLLFPGKTQFTDAPAPKGLKIHSAINSINPFNWNKVGKEIKNLRPDLVIVAYWMPFMSPSLGKIARIIRKNGHSRVIGLVHNLVPHEKRIGDHLLTNSFVKSVDGFVSLSHSVLKDIDSFDKLKPKSFSPHPIYDHYGPSISKEQAKRNLNLDEKLNYVLFFGFIREYKGLDILLEAFADKRIREMNLKLIIAGEYYSDSKSYINKMGELGIENDVITCNEFIPENKVVDYFCAADIVAQPYKTATQSGVTQIAYHFNKPMIVTNVGGLAEMVPNGKVGYVIEPNAKAIADSLVDFYTNKREIEFSKNAEIEKKRFDWKLMVEKMKQVYSKIKL